MAQQLKPDSAIIVTTVPGMETLDLECTSDHFPVRIELKPVGAVTPSSDG